MFHSLFLLLLTNMLTHPVLVKLVSCERDRDQKDEEDDGHDAFDDANVRVSDTDPHPDVRPEGKDGRDGEDPQVCNLFDFIIFATDSNN